MDDNFANAAESEQVDALMGMLGGDDEPKQPETDETQSASDGGDAPAEAPASDDQPAEGDAAEPGESSAIEAPHTFTAELKERFSKLPPDLQQTLAQWETERNSGVNAKLSEAAAQRKALEDAQGAIQSERARLAQQLDQAVQLYQSFNPTLAEGLKMTPDDWAKLAVSDKAGFIEKRALFEAEVAKVQGAMQERDRLQAQQRTQTAARERDLLLTALPELKDAAKAKAFVGDVSSALSSYGFQAEEISSVMDHRMLKVVRDAILYRKGEAARQSAAKKAAAPVVPRTLKPGSGEQGRDKAALSASQKRALEGNDTHAAVDALMGLLN